MIRYWLGGIAVVLLLGYLSRRGERADGASRPLRRAGTPATPTDVDALLRGGRKIEAIKLYRSLHGVDLKTAKHAIDTRARELGR